MAESTDRTEGTPDTESDEELRQPAQEIVDPRDENPEPDAPDVEISGTYEPEDA